jgi:acetyl esterase/lipase
VLFPRTLVRALSPILLTPIIACAPRQLAESLLAGNHFELLTDLPYGPGAQGFLDLYRPRHLKNSAPVIVFLYGGRWQSGSKDEYRLLGGALTREGVLAVVPEYSKYPEVRFPVWVEEAARAVRWVRDSIGRFGGDPSRIFVMGHSSGAHTATLLALDDHYLRDAGVPGSAVRGFISLAGPVATTWTDPDVQALMGPRNMWPRTYPMEQVNGSAPPLLLLHGGRDQLVSSANSTRLAARIRAHGGCAPVILYRGLDHVGIVLALVLPRFNIAPVMDDVMAFVRQTSAKASKKEARRYSGGPAYC